MKHNTDRLFIFNYLKKEVKTMSVSLSKAMEKQIMDAARAKAKELAVEARKSIKNEYIRMIREFYAEQVFVSETGATTNYPRYYDRNFKSDSFWFSRRYN